jgi:electron transport complex protein RnfG
MKVWDMIKLGLVLMIYAGAACVGLAFVYGATVSTIEANGQKELEAALGELFPPIGQAEGPADRSPEGSPEGSTDRSTDRFEEVIIESGDPAVHFEKCYAIRQGGVLTGAAIQASAGSYGGPITVLSGIGVDGRISRVKIMDHSDTPGLGANAGKPRYYVDKSRKITFYGQFSGKGAEDPFEARGDVAAITAATITSRAVSLAVKASARAASRWLAEQNLSGEGGVR